MSGALQGVGIIAIAIILGWLLQRISVLPPQSAGVLSAFVYWAAAPTLLFNVIAKQDIAAILGIPLLVAVLSGFASVLAFLAAGATVLRQRGGKLVLGAMSAAANNIAYMGIPVATYVLDSTFHVVPVMVFQMGLLTPVFFVLADLSGKKKPDSRWRIWDIAKTTLKNPMVVGSFGGVVVSWSGIRVPETIMEITSFLGQAAAPTILVAFGASLVGQSVRLSKQTWLVVGWASFCKLVIQPLVAGLVGWAFGLRGMVFAGVIIMAALPTALNAFIASMRAGAGEEIAQGTVLITTALSLPLMVVLGAVLGHMGIFASG